MSQFRVYFYDLTTRQELVDHPANGKTWVATSGWFHNGKEFVQDTCTSVTVADWSTLRKVKGERTVTRQDFTGPVAVKVWYGPMNSGPRVEWRKLVHDNGQA